jgi:hypothetical protein
VSQVKDADGTASVSSEGIRMALAIHQEVKAIHKAVFGSGQNQQTSLGQYRNSVSIVEKVGRSRHLDSIGGKGIEQQERGSRPR